MEHDTEFVLRVRTYFEHSGAITLEEASRLLNTPVTLLERLLEEGIVQPLVGGDGRPRVDSALMPVIERSLRLHEDLGVNWAGIAIIRDLLERVEVLTRELNSRIPREGAVRDVTIE